MNHDKHLSQSVSKSLNFFSHKLILPFCLIYEGAGGRGITQKNLSVTFIEQCKYDYLPYNLYKIKVPYIQEDSSIFM